jgi:hypothetical protein
VIFHFTLVPPVPLKEGRAPSRGASRWGGPPKFTPHQEREAIRRGDQGEETLAELARSYDVGKSMISRLRA